ncbi:hypothetical protein ACN1NW_000477 [Acinetobacter baumannii]|nr:hypothetical protein [Acinetobacter baumannii]ELA7031059.1 hypothetical protein [Acinetobacter baumannii]ELA7118822.1 hypothetical protein [Acinetobacter baumannii]ELB0919772.1 hypothetical protein [Acinetobacter baumannii]ELB0965949.1 hypothetical protein [Acinetobacter baumannii]
MKKGILSNVIEIKTREIVSFEGYRIRLVLLFNNKTGTYLIFKHDSRYTYEVTKKLITAVGTDYEEIYRTFNIELYRALEQANVGKNYKIESADGKLDPNEFASDHSLLQAVIDSLIKEVQTQFGKQNADEALNYIGIQQLEIIERRDTPNWGAWS